VVDPASNLASVAYLSAHFGFGDATTPIPNYDARLTQTLARRMIDRGIYAAWPERSAVNVSGGWSANGGINLLCGVVEHPTPFRDIAFCGGRFYLDVMRSFVNAFRETGHVATDAKITEINGAIGQMRQQLRTWLTGCAT